MPLSLRAFPVRRLVWVRFVRAAPVGDPLSDAPDVDERGYLTPFQGPAVSVAAGRTVKVALNRFLLETRTPLFIESSDPAIVRVADPASGALPAADTTVIQFTGVDGGTDSRTARLRVRIGTATGPIVHELHVVVFRPVAVRVTPHVVTINGTRAAGRRPVADVTAIMQKVSDIWIPAGVTFTVLPTQQKSFAFKTANILGVDPFPDEMGVMVANRMPDGTPNFIPNTINVYFVVQIGVKNVLGFGFSRASFRPAGLPNPAIVLGDQSPLGPRSGVMNFAQTLAHEFGHFFQLSHAGNAQIPNEREDTWSRRMLMHNFNPIRGVNPFPANDQNGKPFTQRPRFDDIGYGSLNAGCLITIKDLPQFTGDGECFAARAAILTPPGPF